MVGVIEWFQEYGRVVQTFAILLLLASSFYMVGNIQGFREGFEMGNELGRIEAEVNQVCEGYPPFEITVRIPTNISEIEETEKVIHI